MLTKVRTPSSGQSFRRRGEASSFPGNGDASAPAGSRAFCAGRIAYPVDAPRRVVVTGELADDTVAERVAERACLRVFPARVLARVDRFENLHRGAEGEGHTSRSVARFSDLHRHVLRDVTFGARCDFFSVNSVARRGARRRFRGRSKQGPSWPCGRQTPATVTTCSALAR